MARRRLMTILATTTVAAGMAIAPASAQSLEELTSPLEDSVEDVTGVVEDTTQPVTSTVDDGADTQTTTTDDGDSTLDTNDLPLPDDLPLDTDLEVDVAPEDEDGSPQLEIDGGVTVADETVDVGSTTDPLEDVVDPNPAPPRQPSDADGETGSGDQTGTSSNSVDHWARSRPGGVLEGGAVTAAGTAPRAVGDSRPGTSPAGSAMGESVAAFAAGNRGSNSSRGGDDTTAPNASDVPPPRVASPRGEPLETDSGPGAEQPSTMATPVASDQAADARDGLVKALAAMMVLGTAVVVSRRTLGRA